MAAAVDLVIRNALLIDGSGDIPRRGDLAVHGDRIVGLGELGALHGGVEHDASGYALAPGFIDVHTHDDRLLLTDPTVACKASQGVTTVVTGNCGLSLAPLTFAGRPPSPLDLVAEDGTQCYPSFAAYRAALAQSPPAVNVLALVGHTTLRIGALSRLDRPADRAEIARMQAALEASLAAGAIGLSTGLFYPPAQAAPTAEVIALAEVLRAHDALYTTHMRDEGDRVVTSLRETFEIGSASGAAVVISHHKCAGRANHGRSRETLALIDEARLHQRVGLDVYPYIAGSTMLDPDRSMGATRIVVTWSKGMPEAAGRDLAELAREHGVSQREMAERLRPAGAIYFMMSEADVQRILAHPAAMIGSDGLPHDTHPHPRLWGTFPRVLGHYARELGLFPLEEAVRKMTALPAAQFGVVDRGALRVGAFADLVLFDPETVIDEATFEAPARPARGIARVWVNGRATWDEAAATGARPGRLLPLQDLARKDMGQHRSLLE
jgi:N-acyl-D-amino-acid deacylase